MPKPKIDLLKSVGAKASRQAAKPKDDRPVLNLSATEESQVAELVELAALNSEVEPLVKQRKNAVGDMLFNDHWLKSLWETRNQPENPRVIIMKRDEQGNLTSLEDMKCLMQVKFKANALAAPDADAVPKDKTVSDVLISTLKSVAGLSEKNAVKFVEEEVDINDRTTLLKSFDEFYYSEDKAEVRFAEKLLGFLNMRFDPAKKTVLMKDDCPTDYEIEKFLIKKQEVRLKEGLFQRICTYCDNIEQLKKLFAHIRPVIQVANFEFGISDDPRVRADRMKKTIEDHLIVGD